MDLDNRTKILKPRPTSRWKIRLDDFLHVDRYNRHLDMSYNRLQKLLESEDQSKLGQAWQVAKDINEANSIARPIFERLALYKTIAWVVPTLLSVAAIIYTFLTR